MSLLSSQTYNNLSNVEKKQYILKLRVIKHLWLSGSSTVQNICADINASSPTVMSILSDLLAKDQIEKFGQGASIGGRKPDLFRLQDNTFYLLSIHMEKFRIRMVIVDNNNNYISEIESLPIEISKDTSALDALYQHADNLINNSKIEASKLLAVGISMPGLISASEGKNFTYLHTEDQTSITSILEKKFKKRVYIQNDAKALALAERHLGQAKDKRDVLALSIDWGIGLGIITDNTIQSGISGFAGEFGHIPMVDDGLLCHCGKRGCLETIASGLALTRMTKAGLEEGHQSILSKLTEQEYSSLETKDIIAAANAGDQFAIKMLSKIGVSLGKGLAILIQLFNPELIILGGKIAAAKQYITTPIQQSINTYCMTQLREKTTILISELGEDAGLKGGIAIIMENLFLDQFALDEPKKKHIIKYQKITI